jgi:hypothetical protein
VFLRQTKFILHLQAKCAPSMGRNTLRDSWSLCTNAQSASVLAPMLMCITAPAHINNVVKKEMVN